MDEVKMSISARAKFGEFSDDLAESRQKFRIPTGGKFMEAHGRFLEQKRRGKTKSGNWRGQNGKGN